MYSLLLVLIFVILIIGVEYYLATKFNDQYLDKYELLNDIKFELGKGTRIIKKPGGFDFEFKSGDLTEEDINSKFQRIKDSNKKFNLELKQISSGLYKILVTIKKI